MKDVAVVLLGICIMALGVQCSTPLELHVSNCTKNAENAADNACQQCPRISEQYDFTLDQYRGSVATQMCNKACDVNKKPLKWRVCQSINSTLQWSTPTPCACLTVDKKQGHCVHLYRGYTLSTGTSPGSEASKECDDENCPLRGKSFVNHTCNGTTQLWSNPNYDCVCNIASCGSLSGEYTYSDGLYSGSVATAACYNVNLTCPSDKSVLKKRECKLSEKSGKYVWSAPKCECHTDTMCPELGYKYSYSNGLLPDSVARYRCTLNRPCSNDNPKYKTRRCVITEQYGTHYWSSFTPCKCRSEYPKKDDCADLGSEYSYTNKAFRDSVATKTCYRRCTVGSDSVIEHTCKKNESGVFEWTNQYSKCRCRNGCPLLRKESTYLDSSNVSIGTRRCFRKGLTCSAGDSKIKKRECKLNGGKYRWTQSGCNCQPGVCENLGDGVPYTTGLAVGSEARPNCSTPRVRCSIMERVVRGYAVCMCQQDGTWSGSCSGCNSLAQMGYKYSDGLFLGSVATNVCDDAHVTCSSGDSKLKKRECKLSYLSGKSVWSQPKCECHSYMCQNLGGEYTYSNDLLLNSVASTVCSLSRVCGGNKYKIRTRTCVRGVYEPEWSALSPCKCQSGDSSDNFESNLGSDDGGRDTRN